MARRDRGDTGFLKTGVGQVRPDTQKVCVCVCMCMGGAVRLRPHTKLGGVTTPQNPLYRSCEG